MELETLDKGVSKLPRGAFPRTLTHLSSPTRPVQTPTYHLTFSRHLHFFDTTEHHIGLVSFGHRLVHLLYHPRGVSSFSLSEQVSFYYTTENVGVRSRKMRLLLETNKALHRYPGEGCFRFHRHMHGLEGRLAPARGVRFDCFPRRFANNLQSIHPRHGVFLREARLLYWCGSCKSRGFFILVVMGLTIKKNKKRKVYRDI